MGKEIEVLLLVATLAVGIVQVAADCSPGEVDINGQCFRFYNNQVSFEEARTMCKRDGYDLASICNIFVNNFIASEAQRSLSMSYGSFWIGYTQKYTNQWQWAGISCPTNYSNWQKGFPFTTDKCATITVPNGQWRNIDCDERLQFVCSRPGGGGGSGGTKTTTTTIRPVELTTTRSGDYPGDRTTTNTPAPTTSLVPACENFDWNTYLCYDGWLKVGKLDYITAQQKVCRAVNYGNSVSIHSSEEMNYIIDVFQMRDEFIDSDMLAWTGLRGNVNSPSSFKWSDGTPVDYSFSTVKVDSCTVDCCFLISPGVYNTTSNIYPAGTIFSSSCDSLYKQVACKYKAIWL